LQLDAVIELIDLLSDFDIALYTGSELSEVPRELLKRLSHVKVGSYRENLTTSVQPYVGSTNQTFISLGGHS
jgi:hypothetical protein